MASKTITAGHSITRVSRAFASVTAWRFIPGRGHLLARFIYRHIPHSHGHAQLDLDQVCVRLPCLSRRLSSGQWRPLTLCLAIPQPSGGLGLSCYFCRLQLLVYGSAGRVRPVGYITWHLRGMLGPAPLVRTIGIHCLLCCAGVFRSVEHAHVLGVYGILHDHCAAP